MEQIDERLSSKVWIPARRFPLEQGDKIRPIDDFSEFGINSAFGSEERVSLKSLDSVVAVVRAWQESVIGDAGEVNVHDTSGKVHTASLDKEWSELS